MATQYYIKISNTTLKIISSLSTLTTLIYCLPWLRWYSTLREKQIHHRLHWLRCYKKLLLIIHSSMTTLIFRCKRKIVITDYVDYPVLHKTITCAGIFSRKFSVVLHASLALYLHSKFERETTNLIAKFLMGISTSHYVQTLAKFLTFHYLIIYLINMNSREVFCDK